MFIVSTLFTFNCVSKKSYDIVIYGGTSAGVVAAVQAARMQKSVVLIEPGKHLGGLTSGGLGQTDIGNKKAIGGIAREFYHRVFVHYMKDESWMQQKREEYQAGKDWYENQVWWKFEPHVAENIYSDMVREAKVPVVFEER
ncbi:MAG: FAD-dependent oxidoreductase, partial [Calditrichaeota bacterium]|nr:FAD-dependent oxidoreductase [Calditrichota bacterium]